MKLGMPEPVPEPRPRGRPVRDPVTRWTEPDAANGVRRWQPPAPDLDPWTILRLSGYRWREQVGRPVWEAARQAATLARDLATPCAHLRAVAVTPLTREATELGSGAVFSGRFLGRLLAECRSAVAFALTLGPAVEAEVTRLGEAGEPLDAYLLDRAAWAAIIDTIRALRRDLADRARADRLVPTHRVGPGHGDWPLGEQARFLALLDADPPPVGVSDAGLLVPFKSVTGVFGLRRPDIR